MAGIKLGEKKVVVSVCRRHSVDGERGGENEKNEGEVGRILR